MTLLYLAGAVCALYARYTLRYLGGPFRPLRSELEELGRQALTALAALFFLLAAIGWR